MPHFTVNTHELKQAALSTLLLAQSLDEGNLPRGVIDGVAGDHRVDDAYGGFVSNWSDGLAKARQHLIELETRLEDAAQAYEATESDLVSREQQASADLGGPGPSGRGGSHSSGGGGW